MLYRILTFKEILPNWKKSKGKQQDSSQVITDPRTQAALLECWNNSSSSLYRKDGTPDLFQGG